MCFAMVLIAFPSASWANIGVPMISLTLPLMIVSLIPVIFIEARIISTDLQLTSRSASKASAVANVVSMLVGVPVTWVILVALVVVTGGSTSGNYDFSTPLGKFLSVTWQAPWLMPYEDDLSWMIPVAMLVLLVPFFLVSWKIEARIVARMTQLDRKSVNSTCLKANAVTYALMAIVVGGFFFYPA